MPQELCSIDRCFRSIFKLAVSNPLPQRDLFQTFGIRTDEIPIQSDDCELHDFP